MRYVGVFGATLALAALLLIGGRGPARAASTVDVTYDLAESTLNWEFALGLAIYPVSNQSANGTVAGSMQIRYASDGSTQMPIEHGTATLQTVNLTAKSLAIHTVNGTRVLGSTYLTGTLHWQLTTPAVGNLTSSGVLTGINANMLLTGSVGCAASNYGGALCSYYWGLQYGLTIHPNRYLSGAINLAGDAGPAGGALSTRHTLTGTASAVYFRPGNAVYALGTPDFNSDNDQGGTFIVGREVLREAEGHDPKVIPEPGTLLLLGAGTAGLALVGRATRRSKQS